MEYNAFIHPKYKKRSTDMKRIFSFVLTLLFLLPLAILPTSAETYYDYDNDLQYEILEEEVAILDYSGSHQDFTLPDTIDGYPVTVIREYAFAGSIELERITLPDTVTLVEQKAFAGCTSLKGIVLPEALTTIRNGAFFNCQSLTYVVLPQGITQIESGAFDDCDNLSTVFYPGTQEEWDNLAFEEEIPALRNIRLLFDYTPYSGFQPEEVPEAVKPEKENSFEPKNLPLCIVIFVVLFIDGCMALASRN